MADKFVYKNIEVFGGEEQKNPFRFFIDKIVGL
jgi:hypothetical protein